MLNDTRATIRVEEVSVGRNSELIGKTFMEARIPDKTGLLVVAVRKSDSEGYALNPGPDQVIDQDDIMIVMGEIDNVYNLRRLAGHK
jgi:voltage-gated potassium channel